MRRLARLYGSTASGRRAARSQSVLAGFLEDSHLVYSQGLPLSWPQHTPRDAESESMRVISGGPGIGTGHLAEAQKRRWSGREASILQHPGAALKAGRTRRSPCSESPRDPEPLGTIGALRPPPPPDQQEDSGDPDVEESSSRCPFQPGPSGPLPGPASPPGPGTEGAARPPPAPCLRRQRRPRGGTSPLT